MGVAGDLAGLGLGVLAHPLHQLSLLLLLLLLVGQRLQRAVAQVQLLQLQALRLLLELEAVGVELDLLHQLGLRRRLLQEVLRLLLPYVLLYLDTLVLVGRLGLDDLYVVVLPQRCGLPLVQRVGALVALRQVHRVLFLVELQPALRGLDHDHRQAV